MKGKAPVAIRRRCHNRQGKYQKKEKSHFEVVEKLGIWTWKLIAGLATFVTLIGGIGVYFQFRPTVEISTPIVAQDDTTELFSNPFILKTSSPWFSVYDLHPMCVVYRIWRGTPDQPMLEGMNAAADYVPAVPELKAGEQHSLPCATFTKSSQPIVRAEVGLVLDSFLPLSTPDARNSGRQLFLISICILVLRHSTQDNNPRISQVNNQIPHPQTT